MEDILLRTGITLGGMGLGWLLNKTGARKYTGVILAVLGAAAGQAGDSLAGATLFPGEGAIYGNLATGIHSTVKNAKEGRKKP